MRGGSLPPALLCAALGFALAFAPRRMIAICLALLCAAATAAAFLRLGPEAQDPVFLGCWLSVIAAAATVHLPGGVGPKTALGLALNTGAWAGAVVAAAGAKTDLLIAIPAALICLPGGWLVARGHSIVLKVASGWLVAVSLLAIGLQFAPTTPGYKPDHMD